MSEAEVKVSTKIISGFLILMLLAIAVVAYELSVVYQMQAVNHELAGIDINAATTALDMEKLADLLKEDSEKYFGGLDPIYDRQTASYRDDFVEDLTKLEKTVRSESERAGTARAAHQATPPAAVAPGPGRRRGWPRVPARRCRGWR